MNYKYVAVNTADFGALDRREYPGVVVIPQDGIPDTSAYILRMKSFGITVLSLTAVSSPTPVVMGGGSPGVPGASTLASVLGKPVEAVAAAAKSLWTQSKPIVVISAIGVVVFGYAMFRQPKTRTA